MGREHAPTVEILQHNQMTSLFGTHKGVHDGATTQTVSDKDEIVYGGARAEVPIQSAILTRGRLSQLAPSSAHRPTQRLSDGHQYALALIASECDRVRCNIIHKIAHRLVYRRALRCVDVGFVEVDRFFGGAVDRRPGQLIEDKVAFAPPVGEPEEIKLTQRFFSALGINKANHLGPR